MGVVVKEWLDEDAAEPEHLGLYEIDDPTCFALKRYVRDGVVDPSIRDGIEKIINNWYDLGYEKSDANQRDHTTGLFVITYGDFCGCVGDDMKTEARFSTTYTTSLSAEELGNLFRR